MVTCALFIFSCNDYLGFEQPASTLAKDAFNTSTDAIQATTAAYVPLQWEYGYGTFFYEWWIGDVCTDDALKGGEALDATPLAYDLENFKTRSDNDILYRYYRAQYIGAFRANFARENIEKMDDKLFESGLKNRLIGEALFLRAMYHLRLVRVFGGVPVADRIIYVQAEWKQDRASEREVYAFIENDLKHAIPSLPTQDKYPAADAGRVSKGAARALLMKVYLNQGKYDEAKLQGDSIINQDPYRYQLMANYNDNFDYTKENNKESLFEIQYLDNSLGDWGGDFGGMGATRANWTTVMTRPRWALQSDKMTPAIGWGWNRPTQELYDEFEPGDMRRDATIINPSEEIAPTESESATNLYFYLGNRYHSRKYSMMLPDTTFVPLDSNNPRGEINHKEIRYSDVLLMYAEACVKSATPDLPQAKWALEQVRNRARTFSGGSVLPEFPNYEIPLHGVGQGGAKQLQDNAEDLYLAIQHERRVELAMEGHRWFDLKRWGLLYTVMNHYRETTKPHIAEHIAPFVKGKHELFPIPLQERDLNPMAQNPGYDGVPVN
jgi:hypothetical protein